MTTTKIFYDSEFTGLTQTTELISIGLITESGESFYAEFTDFNRAGCDDWLKDNVLIHCRHLDKNVPGASEIKDQAIEVWGDKNYVTHQLTLWLNQFKQIEIWADCHAYDWVLFCQLYGGAFGIPGHIHYMPGDIATVFRLKGLDPDTNREEFALQSGLSIPSQKHNALWDARISMMCYQRLLTLKD